MADRLSPIQANYPVPIDFVIIARRLRADAIEVMLGFVWGGYDRLLKHDSFAVSENNAHLEDEITKALYCRIQDFMRASDPFSAFVILHQWSEGEQAKDTGRQPQCDLAFRMIGGNVRSHFTIEAKVIRTDGAVSEYCDEITGNLLTGRYSTYSSEAAMLGYLLSGCPTVTFDAIAKSLNCKLLLVAAFKTRQHRYSDHQRKGLSGDSQTTSFRCHHLILKFPPNRLGREFRGRSAKPPLFPFPNRKRVWQGRDNDLSSLSRETRSSSRSQTKAGGFLSTLDPCAFEQ